MIERIEMSVPNYTLIIKGNKGIINDKSIFITKEDIDDIARIIRLWKSKYINNSVLNEVKYYINLYDKDGNDIGKYLFDGDYPDNFNSLIIKLGEIYARS